MRCRQRWMGGGLVVAGLAAALFLACDDGVAPDPPKHGNQPPETWLVVQSDSLGPQLYKLALRWQGSDPDGRVVRYRLRWTCLGLSAGTCRSLDSIETAATSDTFALYVPGGTGSYALDVAAVDGDGAADPSPAHQVFDVFNTVPVAAFEPGLQPALTLPAVTFYLQAVDPDSTADPEDGDSRTDLVEYRAWLDGAEDRVRTAPVARGSVTFRPEDFDGHYGPRTVSIQVVDDGGGTSPTVRYTWTVQAPPADGILLVDDCRMGGALENFSDTSFRRVLEAGAPGGYVVLDVETIPRLSAEDLEATLSLFDRVVWYTDSDITSSGAFELARTGLDSLLGRSGRLFVSSGVVFGTDGALGDQEARFRDLFGIETLFEGPDGSTNFALGPEDLVRAAVQPGLEQFRYLSLGLGAIMECFGSRRDAATRSLYFYPESTFVRATSDTLQPFVNPVQFDIGVEHELPNGGRTAFVSFPIGVPINDVASGDNEIEIRAILELLGILQP